MLSLQLDAATNISWWRVRHSFTDLGRAANHQECHTAGSIFCLATSRVKRRTSGRRLNLLAGPCCKALASNPTDKPPLDTHALTRRRRKHARNTPSDPYLTPRPLHTQRHPPAHVPSYSTSHSTPSGACQSAQPGPGTSECAESSA
eukprot:365594-Chlamydomonas_euryale.AAC.4